MFKLSSTLIPRLFIYIELTKTNKNAYSKTTKSTNNNICRTFISKVYIQVLYLEHIRLCHFCWIILTVLIFMTKDWILHDFETVDPSTDLIVFSLITVCLVTLPLFLEVWYWLGLSVTICVILFHVVSVSERDFFQVSCRISKSIKEYCLNFTHFKFLVLLI